MEYGLWKWTDAIFMVLISTLIFEHGHTVGNNRQGRFVSPFTSKTSSDEFNCTSDGYYGNKRNCSIFHRCVEVVGQSEYDSKIFRRYDFECPPGSIFDTLISNCNHPWAAKPTGGCNSLNSTPEMTTNLPHPPNRPSSPTRAQGRQIKIYNIKEKSCVTGHRHGEEGYSQGLYKCDGEEFNKGYKWYVKKISTDKKTDRFTVRFSDSFFNCLEGDMEGNVYLRQCSVWTNYQHWVIAHNKSIIHRESGGCLYAKGSNHKVLAISKDHCKDKWELKAEYESNRLKIYSVQEKTCVDRNRVVGNTKLHRCDSGRGGLSWYVLRNGEKDREGRETVFFSDVTKLECLDGDKKGNVYLHDCNDAGYQIWALAKDKSIVHDKSGACLYVKGTKDKYLATSHERCDAKWELKFY